MNRKEEVKNDYNINNKDCLCSHVHLNYLNSRIGKYFYKILYNDLNIIIKKRVGQE